MEIIKKIKQHNLFSVIKRNKYLIWQITRRDIENRYKGTFLGLLWTAILPVFLLSVYTFVFGVIFQVRWDVEVTNNFDFALVLFAGVNLYNMFAENLNRAPSLILNNPNYVKKVVFPVEILPITIVGSSLFNMFIGYGILIILYAFVNGLSFTILLLPAILIPLLFFTLGVSWLFSSLGVYIRDISNLSGILVTLFMFMTPIFYPISSIPEGFRFIYYINPLTYVVTEVRQVLLWNQIPSISEYLILLAACFAFMELSYIWFMKTKKGFADVL